TGAAASTPAQVRIANGGLTVSGAGTVFTAAAGIDLAPGSTAGATAALTVSGGGVLVTPGLFVDADTTTTGTATKTVTLDAGTLQANGAITVGGTGLSVTLGAGGGTINTNGNAVTLNAPVGGAGGLTKTGTGTLTLAGAGTYAGPTLVQNGTLSFAAGALPAGSNLTLASATSATLQWFGTNTSDVTAGRTVTLAGTTGSTGIGTFLDTNGNNVTLTGNLLGTNAGQLSKVGAGTLTLQGSANPTSLFVKAGTLALDGAAAQVTTTNYISIGQANGDVGTLVLRNGAKLTVPNDFNVSDVTVTRGSMIVQGTGTTVALRTLYVGKSGASIGAVSQSGGSVGPNAAPSGDWRIGGGGTGTADANVVGTYDLSGGTFATGQNLQIGANGKGQFNQTGGTVTVSGGFTAAGRYATGVGQINVSGGTFTFTPTGNQLAASEQGAGSINVSGTGTLTTASNVGLNLSINGGTGQVNLGTGGTIAAKAVFQGTAANTSGTFNFHGGTLKATAATATFMQGLTGAYVWPEGGTIDTNGNNLTVAQNLLAPPAGSGVGSVAVTGGGTGYVTAPIVQIARGTGDTTGVGAVAVATIDAGGAVTGVTMLNPGTGYTVAPTITLLGGNPATAATGVTGTLAATGASGGLTKTGAGTLTLTGANTYAGTTTVSAGTLVVNGSLASGSTVNNGGTLGGSGTIAGAVTANSGSTVSPGNSPGVLSTGTLTLAAGSTALMEINGTTAGTQYDQLNVTGTVTLGGGALQVALGYTPLVGDTFRLINNDGTADPVVGTFAGLPTSGSTFQSGGATFAINYAGGDGNDVTLTTTVPEPASAGALLAAAAAGLLARRRRRAR
ncbi:MAG TPA: autotransporter-associated beta strand repeat-containing protein, partial [Humisphaera sp.]